MRNFLGPVLFTLLAFSEVLSAQHIYYKNPQADLIKTFNDSAYRCIILNPQNNSIIEHQLGYLLKFYPSMPFKNIVVKMKKASYTVKIQPKFTSVFKSPNQRIYKLYIGTGTKSTLDSVLINTLSFNSQLGMLANQLSLMEDLSAGGFFNFLGWYSKNLTHKGRRKLYREAELKTLDLGLGYQLLAYNTEFLERLKIENWQSTRGYTYYMKHYRNYLMKPSLILNFISDLPVYQSNTYK